MTKVRQCCWIRSCSFSATLNDLAGHSLAAIGDYDDDDRFKKKHSFIHSLVRQRR
jgi:hypothetical protein